MKKKIAAVVMTAGLIMVGTATVNWAKGGGGYGHHGQMMQSSSIMYQQLDPAVREKISKFMLDSRALRKEMMVKRAEKQAMLLSSDPDAVAVARITGEIFDLRTAMRKKALAAGLGQYIGRFGMRSGMGPGMMGHGPGYRMGGCRFQ